MVGMNLGLNKILGILLKQKIKCRISDGELLEYLKAPTYEKDLIQLNEILNEELLLLHEVAEVCILKNMGYGISKNIFKEAYPDTYKAHLEALNIELAEAERQSRLDWIDKRCKDLFTYLSDPYLPSNFKDFIHKLTLRYCNRIKNHS